NSLPLIKSINTSDVPGFPASTVEGHRGKIHFAEFESKKILLFQGRVHFYEGYHISDCMLPVFIAHHLRCKKLILTNAAGGINSELAPGDLMLDTAFNSMNIRKELTSLIGLASLEAKNRFISFPVTALNETVRRAAAEENISLKEGNYWYTKGPSYETPAEIRMIGKFGGDAVGMSTVHEATYAEYLGIETASISCITNYAAGISDVKLSHNDVTETADRVKLTFERLIKKIIAMA
ncbi:MAG: purine-nucleoside phosphorylase, partial [Methanococcaceae archaeon]